MEAQIEKQLEKIAPEDISRTLESLYHVVFQGNHEHIDDLLKHGGSLLRKAAQRFTSTQLILGIAGVAVVAVIAVNKMADMDGEEGTGAAEHADDDQKDRKAAPQPQAQ